MSIEENLAKVLGENANEETLGQLKSIFEEQTQAVIENEVSGLKSNNKKLLDQMAKLKQNQLPEGMDADQINSLMEEHQQLEQKQAELEEQRLAAEGQWESLKMKLQETHNGKLNEIVSSKDEEIGSLKSALDKELIENQAIKAIEKEQGNSFFLLPHMKNQLKTVVEDGKYTVKVLDSDGQYRFNDQGENFTIADLVAEMKSNEMYSPAFPSQNTGSGNSVNSGSNFSATSNPWKAETKNVTMQAKMMMENPKLAEQMKKAAGIG